MGRLEQRLATGRPLLLDGAMGTELDLRGVTTYLPLWSALGLIDRPEVVREIHRDYVDAGADVLITNTFRTTRRTLAKSSRDPNDVGELNRLAVQLAREAAAAAGRDVLIAGSIAPLEDCYSPHLSPAPDIARAEHAEQATLLAEAGVDFLMIETMPLLAEAEAAIDAALETGLEVTAGFVLGDDGRTLAGESLAQVAAAMERAPISALIVNCTPLGLTTRAVAELRKLTETPLGAYANLGAVEETVGWRIDAEMTGDRYAPHALDWLDAGASMIGGCCGTRPEHIAALRRMLDRPA